MVPGGSSASSDSETTPLIQEPHYIVRPNRDFVHKCPQAKADCVLTVSSQLSPITDSRGRILQTRYVLISWAMALLKTAAMMLVTSRS